MYFTPSPEALRTDSAVSGMLYVVVGYILNKGLLSDSVLDYFPFSSLFFCDLWL